MEFESITKPKFNVQHCYGEIPNNATALEKSLDLNCYVRMKLGNCRAAIPGYYFDFKYRVCKLAIYGGCGGCVPFYSMLECEDKCSSKLPKFTKEEKQKIKEKEEEEEEKERIEKQQSEEEVNKQLEQPKIPENNEFKQNLKLLEDDIFNSKNPELLTSDPFDTIEKVLVSTESNDSNVTDEDPFSIIKAKQERDSNEIKDNNKRNLNLSGNNSKQLKLPFVPITNFYSTPITLLNEASTKSNSNDLVDKDDSGDNNKENLEKRK
ncbi:hypothetical protein K502DRAFT_367135 [Neoconidiobolus thromboides FSU 785]|nr:hypothetical protein K502DRAFT_367135 [Neoconidiobolus thromboides FSU 785]